MEGSTEADWDVGEESSVILNDLEKIRDFLGNFTTQVYPYGEDGSYYFQLDPEKLGNYIFHGALGVSTHAEGINNVACDKAGHVEGYNNVAGDMIPGHGQDSLAYAQHVEIRFFCLAQERCKARVIRAGINRVGGDPVGSFAEDFPAVDAEGEPPPARLVPARIQFYRADAKGFVPFRHYLARHGYRAFCLVQGLFPISIGPPQARMGNARFKRKMLEPRSEPLVAPFDGANRFAFQAQGKPRVRIQCAEHIQVFHHNFPAQPGLPVRQLLRGDMQSAYRHLAVQFQIRHFHDAASGDARRPIPAENVLRLAQKGPTLVAAICSAIAALRAHRAVDLRKIPIAYIL